MSVNKMLQNPIPWYIDFEIYCIFEVPLENLKDKIPEMIKPIEIRPNIGLVGLGVMNFIEGNIVRPESQYKELSFSVVTQTNFKLLGNAIPKNSFIPLSIMSDSSDFLDFADNVDNMPIYRSENFKLEIDYSNYSICCSDSEGAIFEIEISSIPNIKEFESKIFEDQLFTIKDNSIFCANLIWNGRLFETQDSNMIKNCKIYNHPFFKGINIENALNNFYLIMLSPSRDIHTATFHKPLKIRDLK